MAASYITKIPQAGSALSHGLSPMRPGFVGGGATTLPVPGNGMVTGAEDAPGPALDLPIKSPQTVIGSGGIDRPPVTGDGGQTEAGAADASSPVPTVVGLVPTQAGSAPPPVAAAPPPAPASGHKAAIAAGAGAGFLVGGPLGAAVGAGLAWWRTRSS